VFLRPDEVYGDPKYSGAPNEARAIDAGRVRALGANENVEDLRRAGMAMVRDRVAAENDELSTGVVQLDEQVAEVVRELYYGWRRGTNREGI
jgi:hypothetical protein